MKTQEMQAAYERWCKCANADLQEQLAGMQEDDKAIEDAFYRDLEFGTAGLRGVIGAGSNRMNVHTVGRATQGLANYLLANAGASGSAPSVSVCRDSRNMGQEFVRTVACVLAGNGVHAYLYPRIEPTPALSFAVRDLGCDAGINVTASHNPAEYNGYKVYGPDGCQITTKAANDIQAAIESIDIFDDVKAMDFDQAVEAGLVSWIGEDTLDRFIDAVAAQSVDGSENGEAGVGASDGAASGAASAAEQSGLKLVYTPLNGTGIECVERILKRIGIDDVTVVPEQAQPDGNFPTCPYPNPEIREALQKGLELCESVGADLLLATDPDADRVGIAVRHGDEYRLLSGNEVGILLLDFVCQMRLASGKSLDGCVAISTIVSSTMPDALASGMGFQMRRTLTGFKYIGEQIGMLEAAGEADRFILGFEESYGYLSGSHVRDKDAVNASMLICEMARWYRSKGMDLVEAIESLYERYGYYGNKVISVKYAGADGAEKMSKIMGSLRDAQSAPKQIAGMNIERTVDYSKGVEMPVVNPGSDAAQVLPAANVVEFQLEGGNKLIIRPSGTEPKIKAYMFTRGESAEASEDLLGKLEAAAHEILG